ncbi:endonuclease/exonuclease/phosphatase family protein [Photobacterium sp. 2_MG-2023]|uniref:endonuclease/exonuclease/phosphatase family protein n=1 Tax=Photobacterium sp. 2_MG-2023 TaxID=3062663 RepID=UPI0026E2F360|nr:endonuclease/exonuclease/phosphatase family protein [Photobacterium sp. 2_MG-2023]MDO6583295.1 endonuclease/exonuclease/phosphatase family protein [Photobacterium sp. 2_MG-2023]
MAARLTRVNRIRPDVGMTFILILCVSFFSMFSYASDSLSSFGREQPQRQSLTVMSWNLEWFGTPRVPRTDADYAYFTDVIRRVSPDIIAFQEADSKEAVERILPKDQYSLYLSDRHGKASESFRDGNQYTGFAIRQSLPVSDPQDIASLNIRTAPKSGERARKGRLRYGTYVIVHPQSGTPIHLLSVHLKSGCYTSKINRQSASCRVLSYQAGVLKNWIDQRLAAKESFLISGDFNHRMADSGDWLYRSLSAPSSDRHSVHLLTKDVNASCYVRLNRSKRKAEYRRYTALIDHFVASADIADALRQGKVYQYPFSQKDVSRLTLSDHCPLVLDIPLLPGSGL